MKKLFVLVLVLMMALTACQPAAAPTEAASGAESAPAGEAPAATEAAAPVAAEPKEIMIGLGQESYPQRGWQIETDDGFSMAYIGVLETLVKVDFDGKMVPSLADSWSQVDDTTWEFKLHPGISFTNGEPFNAAAVVKSLTYVVNSPTPPRGISPKTFAAVEAVDDTTVRITTTAFDALLPNRLTSPVTGILAPSAYTAETGPVNPFNTGTGPFILTEEVAQQSLTVVKNPEYWGGPVNLDKATILFVPDSQIRAGMLQTGEIDIDVHLPVEQIAVLEADSNVSVLKMQTPRTTTLHMNLSRPPFDNLKVRQAVSYALDRQAIVDATLEGVASPAVGPISPSEVWVNKDLKGYPYDPEKAIALLTEAGYEKGALTVSLWTYSTRANLPLTAIAIQDMLGKVGINVEVRVAQYDAMEPEVLAGNYDMFIISRNHVLDSYDPEGFLTSDYSCEGSFNMDHFCDATFDAKLAEARALTDLDARYAIYRELQQTLVDDQSVGAFLNYTEIVNGISTKVLNYQIHPLERFIMTPELDIAQ